MIRANRRVNNEFYVVTQKWVFQFDATTWGWIHIILGVVVVVAGCGVLARQTWAVVVGVVLCAISAVGNFAFVPYYPIWSLLIIALNVLVIWALLRYRAEKS